MAYAPSALLSDKQLNIHILRISIIIAISYHSKGKNYEYSKISSLFNGVNYLLVKVRGVSKKQQEEILSQEQNNATLNGRKA